MSDCKLKPDSIFVYDKQSLASPAYIRTQEWVKIAGRPFINRVNSKGPKLLPWGTQRFWIKPSEIYHSNNLKSKLTDYLETRADLIWIKEESGLQSQRLY